MPTLAQYNLHLQFVWEIIIYDIVDNSININDCIITLIFIIILHVSLNK